MNVQGVPSYYTPIRIFTARLLKTLDSLGLRVNKYSCLIAANK
jgi:hypothetical protein